MPLFTITAVRKHLENVLFTSQQFATIMHGPAVDEQVVHVPAVAILQTDTTHTINTLLFCRYTDHEQHRPACLGLNSRLVRPRSEKSRGTTILNRDGFEIMNQCPCAKQLEDFAGVVVLVDKVSSTIANKGTGDTENLVWSVLCKKISQPIHDRIELCYGDGSRFSKCEVDRACTINIVKSRSLSCIRAVGLACFLQQFGSDRIRNKVVCAYKL